jgi:predicted P-loop ATPase
MIKLICYDSLNTKNYTTKSLGEIADEIRSSEALRVVTEKFRQTGDKSWKLHAKAFLTASVISGSRKRDCVQSLTGLSLVDMDHLNPEEVESMKRAAERDPHTVMAYITLSGLGLRIIFAYELDSTRKLQEQMRYYTLAFKTGNIYYSKLLGHDYDDSCKDIVRVSAEPYDPSVYLNTEATPFSAREVLAQRTDRSRSGADKRTVNRLQHLFEEVIEPKFEEAGLRFEPQHHNEYLVSLSRKLSWYGVPLGEALLWARSREFAAEYEDCYNLISRIYDSSKESFGKGSIYVAKYRKKEENTDKEAKLPRAKADDIKAFLTSRMIIRFNEIKGRLEYRDWEDKNAKFHYIDDRVLNTIWCDMDKQYEVRITDINMVVNSDFSAAYNPILDYLIGLPEWAPDQPDYLDELAATVTVEGGESEQKLFRRCVKKWMVGMVASWIDPWVVNQFILVLLGDQGIYKSTWFNFLLPPELSNYFCSKADSSVVNKDDVLALSEFCLMNFDEIDKMDRRNAGYLKSIVTVLNTNIRAAYHHYAVCREHIASMCGTGNERQFLTENIAGRRWAVFWATDIVAPRDNPLNYTGIYSQALYLYRHKFVHYFDKSDIERMTRHNKQFMVPNIEAELIASYIRKPYSTEVGKLLSSTEILGYIADGRISGKVDVATIGKKMREMGFEEKRTKKKRGWICVPMSRDEVEREQSRGALNAEDDKDFEEPDYEHDV